MPVFDHQNSGYEQGGDFANNRGRGFQQSSRSRGRYNRGTNYERRDNRQEYVSSDPWRDNQPNGYRENYNDNWNSRNDFESPRHQQRNSQQYRNQRNFDDREYHYGSFTDENPGNRNDNWNRRNDFEPLRQQQRNSPQYGDQRHFDRGGYRYESFEDENFGSRSQRRADRVSSSGNRDYTYYNDQGYNQEHSRNNFFRGRGQFAQYRDNPPRRDNRNERYNSEHDNYGSRPSDRVDYNRRGAHTEYRQNNHSWSQEKRSQRGQDREKRRNSNFRPGENQRGYSQNGEQNWFHASSVEECATINNDSAQTSNQRELMTPYTSISNPPNEFSIAQQEMTESSESASFNTVSNSLAPAMDTKTSSSFNVQGTTDKLEQLKFTEEQGTSKEISSNIQVDAPMLKSNRDDKKKVIMITNFFPLQVSNKIVYKYDVDMKVVTTNGQTVNLSKKATDSASKTQRDEICMAAIRAALNAYGILREREAILYDNAALLFSSQDLAEELKPNSNTFHVKISSLPADIRRTIHVLEADEIVIEIRPCNSGASTFNIADYQQTHNNRNLDALDRTHQRFFDILTNQSALNSGKFTAFGSGRLFQKGARSLDIRKGQEQINGIDKGIVFIKPKKSESIIPALVLDAKFGRFYKSQDVIKTVCELLNRHPNNNEARFTKAEIDKVSNYVKGMRFTMMVGDTETSFTASGISTKPIEELFEEDIHGNKVSVLNHRRFLNKDIHRVYTRWPAIIVRGKYGNKIVTSYYPMEFLRVAKNQRVPKNKQDDNPPRAIRIQERFERILRMPEALDLVVNNERSHILRAFGVSVSTAPMKIEGIRRKMPTIKFGTKIANVDDAKASFKMQKFAVGAQVDIVVIAFDCPYDFVEKMEERITQSAVDMGIKVSKWIKLKAVGETSYSKVKYVFEKVAQDIKETNVHHKVFIFYLDDDRTKSHGYLKLFERQYLITTQHLTTRVVKDIPNKNDTLQNVLNKMNVKLGGINYSIIPDNYAEQDWISNGKSLIIGYDVAHPTGASRDDKLDKMPPSNASVVGISFNGAPNAETFIGDFHYQLPRKEEVSDAILIDRIKWMLTLFYDNRKNLPENIFIIRDGVSEGQYDMVLNREFPAIQDGISEWKNMKEKDILNVQKWTPKYVVVIVCKRHNKRFALGDGNRFENCLPGTVADDQVTRTDMTHFYMQPHRAIQGTAKFPSYHILKDELDTYDKSQPKTQDKLQAFLFALSFNHQIFPGTISLPEPVYQADEWAKRGNEMFRAYEEHYNIPRLESYNKNIFCKAPIDYEELTKQLCYRDTRLQQFRINA